MDNNAFQKMVRDRDSSSTKQIARAAVEAEFRKRRKGRKRKATDDYSSDSDDEGRRPKSNKKESSSANTSVLLFRPTQVKGSEEEASKYRDRAKERREGGEHVDAKTSSTAGDNNDEVDAALPVATTKGLDLSQVRKERALLRRDGGGSDDSENDSDPLPTAELPSLERAQRNLEQFMADPSSLPLSTEESEYLVQFARSVLLQQKGASTAQHVKCGVEGTTVQRTRLVFCMDAHPSDRPRAWEIPRELMRPQSVKDYPNIPPLSEEILQSLERFFPRKPLEDVTQASSTQKDSPKMVAKGGLPVSDPTGGTIKDDDDDIFAGLDDYVPPDGKAN